jgi:hypothetical protein
MAAIPIRYGARPFDFVYRSSAVLSSSNERRERRSKSDAAGLPHTRLRHDGYYADLIEERRASGGVVHCIIQRDGSPEILFYTQFATFEAAKEWALKELQDYARDQRRA